MTIEQEIKEIIDSLSIMQNEYAHEIKKKTILRRSAGVLIANLRYNSPKDTGNLSESMRVLPLYKSKSSIFVGPDYKGQKIKGQEEGEDEREGIGSHAHLVEYGHITKSGKRIEGQPFIKQTYEETKHLVLRDLKTEIIELQKRLERKLKKSLRTGKA